MTCLIDRVLSGAGMELHSSMLGTFFVYTLAKYADFQEKFFVDIIREDFFLKIGIHRAKVLIYQKRPQHKSI